MRREDPVSPDEEETQPEVAAIEDRPTEEGEGFNVQRLQDPLPLSGGDEDVSEGVAKIDWGRWMLEYLLKLKSTPRRLCGMS